MSHGPPELGHGASGASPRQCVELGHGAPRPFPRPQAPAELGDGPWRLETTDESGGGRERESTSEEGKRHERDLDTATTLWRRKSLAASCSELWAGAAAAGCAGARGGGGGAAELPGFDFFVVKIFFANFFHCKFFFS